MRMETTYLDQLSAVSVAANRRRNRTILLIACLPLLTAFTVVISLRAVEHLSHVLALRDDRRLGHLKQSQAVAIATTLCTRIAGAPAEALDAAGYATYTKAGAVRQGN